MKIYLEDRIKELDIIERIKEDYEMVNINPDVYFILCNDYDECFKLDEYKGKQILIFTNNMMDNFISKIVYKYMPIDIIYLKNTEESIIYRIKSNMRLLERIKNEENT